MQYFTYLLLRVFVILVSLIPFRLLYIFSDFLAFVLHRLIGYRLKVVQDNLKQNFPQRSDKELKQIEKRFYKHLADVTVEALKGMSMSGKDFFNRHHVMNPELADTFFEQGRSIMGTPAHYGNWEWGANSPGVQIKHPVIVLYKPLTNKYVDQWMRKLRQKFNATLVGIRDTFYTFSTNHDKNVCYILAADQSPSNISRAYWVNFLGRETACLHGPEKYARMFNLPVIFVGIRRVKRGFYNLELTLITDNPAEVPEGEITQRYMKHLEDLIIEEPAHWLWSHRRWKHTRPEKA